MEKKNTMLLTVIAVATLLVAVVGATFAYYSVVTSNNAETRTVSATTPKLGTVSLTSLENDLYLTVSGDQMANTNAARTTYYHQESANVYVDADSSRWTKLAKLTVANGEDDTTYSCKFDYSISTNGTMTQVTSGEPATRVLSADDAKFKLRYTKISGKNNVTEFTLPYIENYQSITTSIDNPLTGTVNFKITADAVYDIEAQATFNTDREQNLLANKSMATSITFNNLRCYTGSVYPE